MALAAELELTVATQLAGAIAALKRHSFDAVLFALRPSESIRLFADAFRLRKGPRDG
jgi:hypothetical protein